MINNLLIDIFNIVPIFTINKDGTYTIPLRKSCSIRYKEFEINFFAGGEYFLITHYWGKEKEDKYTKSLRINSWSWRFVDGEIVSSPISGPVIFALKINKEKTYATLKWYDYYYDQYKNGLPFN